MQCSTSQRWYCNSIYQDTDKSCIVEHLVDNGYTEARIHPQARLAKLTVKCTQTHSTNIFALGATIKDGVVHVVTEAAYLRCSTSQGCNGLLKTPFDEPFHPFIVNGAVANWFARAAHSFEVVRSSTEGRAHTFIANSTVVKFADGISYRQTWAALIAECAVYEDRNSNSSVQRGITVQWDEEITGEAIATFQHPTFASKAKAGEPILFSHPDYASIGKLPGVVRLLTGTTISVRIDLNPLVDGLRRATTGFQIQLASSSVSFDRMQTGLVSLAFDEYAMSANVYHGIIGSDCSTLPFMRNHYASVPPDVASLNDEQRVAFQNAVNHPCSIVQGPPGTGKTKVIVPIVRMRVEQEDGRVLVCAASNDAADLVAIKLHAAGIKVLRLVAQLVRNRDIPFEVTLQHHMDVIVSQRIQAAAASSGLSYSAVVDSTREVTAPTQRRRGRESGRRASVASVTINNGKGKGKGKSQGKGHRGRSAVDDVQELAAKSREFSGLAKMLVDHGCLLPADEARYRTLKAKDRTTRRRRDCFRASAAD